MKIKRLDIPPVIKVYFEGLFNGENLSKFGYERAEPVFGKNGFYSVGQRCWVEIEGEAWEIKNTVFTEELRSLNRAEKYDPKVEAALFNLLFVLKFKDKKLLEVYKELKLESHIRKMRRDIVRMRLAALKRTGLYPKKA